jgi:hypothetical protein
MGLDAEKLLGVVAPPFVEAAQDLEEIAEHLEVEPDLGIVEDCAATLRENWERQLARG